MPISSKPINAASKAPIATAAPRRAPMPDVVATAIAAATTAHDDTLPLQKRTAADLDDVDPKTQQPLPHARERIMSHLDELAGEAQEAEKRQIKKALAQAHHKGAEEETAAAAPAKAAPATSKPLVKGMHIDIAERTAAAKAAPAKKQAAAPAKTAPAAGKMLAGMATAEFAEAVKDSEKAGEVEERRHGDLWKQPHEGCSSCDEDSCTSTPSSAERTGKPLNAKGQARLRSEKQAAAPRAAAAPATTKAAPAKQAAAAAPRAAGVGAPAGKMLVGMATAEFAKAVKDSEKAGAIEERRHGDLWKQPHEGCSSCDEDSCTSTPSSAERTGKTLNAKGQARLRTEKQAAAPRAAAAPAITKAAPAKQTAAAPRPAATAAGAPAGKMLAGMATDEFAKAVKDSEKAGAIEERRHGDLWKQPHEGCSSCDEDSCTSTPSSAERTGKTLNAKGKARAAAGASTAAAKMVAGMATQDFAKAVVDSEKAGEIEERRHGNMWKKHGEFVEEATDSVIMSKKTTAPIAGKFTAAKAAPAVKAAPAAAAAAGGKMLAGMATAEFAKAVKDSEKAGAIEERRHGDLWKKPNEGCSSCDEDSCTSTPSSAERTGKPLNAKGQARLRTEKQAAAPRAAAAPATTKAAPTKQAAAAAPRAAGVGAPAGKMLAGMATAEFAKAVKDSEKAGEVEERRHGDLWKQAGESCSSCESSSSNGSATTTPSSAERKQKPLNVAGIRRMRAEYAARAGVTLPAAAPAPQKRAGSSSDSSASSSCTSTPSSAERKGKNLKPSGVARLRRELEAQFPAMPAEAAAAAAPMKKGAKAAATGDVDAAKLVAGMATQEFAKAVKDTEKAGEIEERRHGNLWKKHGEIVEEAADAKAKKGL